MSCTEHAHRLSASDVVAFRSKTVEELTIQSLCEEAAKFAKLESVHAEPNLYGVTDGKAVGTYLEHKFRAYLTAGFHFVAGNSASGIDFPDLGVDMKVTSIKAATVIVPVQIGPAENIRPRVQSHCVRL